MAIAPDHQVLSDDAPEMKHVMNGYPRESLGSGRDDG